MSITKFLRANWDRVGGGLSILAGLVTLIVGYQRISDAHPVSAQLPYLISGGLLGIFLLGFGGLLWVSADLRDEWRQLWLIRDALVRLSAEQSASAGAPLAQWLIDINGDEAETSSNGSRRAHASERT
jgi:hypothetical protein